MRGLAAAILAIGILTTDAAQAQTPVPAQQCRLVQYGSVDMHVADGKVTIPVTIGGVPRDSVFTLSGAFNYMSQEMADQLNLRARSLPRGVSVGTIYKQAIVPELSLGDVKMRAVEFLILPKEESDAGAPPLVIGLEMFGKVDLDLDMASRKLKFFSQDHCPGKAVYWTRDFTQVPFEMQDFGFVRPTMLLDGKPVIVRLDLNSISTISMGTMKQLFGVDEKSPDLTPAGTTDKGASMYRYPFKTLGIADLQVGNPAIRVLGNDYINQCRSIRTRDLPDPKRLHDVVPSELYTCSGGADITLGYSVLSKLHLYFSMKEKVMYSSAADAR
jgi:hypothetical protein